MCGGETDNDCSTGGRKEQSVVSLGVSVDPIIMTLEVKWCGVMSCHRQQGSNELPTEMDGKGVLSLIRLINRIVRLESG